MFLEAFAMASAHTAIALGVWAALRRAVPQFATQGNWHAKFWPFLSAWVVAVLVAVLPAMPPAAALTFFVTAGAPLGAALALSGRLWGPGAARAALFALGIAAAGVFVLGGSAVVAQAQLPNTA